MPANTSSTAARSQATSFRVRRGLENDRCSTAAILIRLQRDTEKPAQPGTFVARCREKVVMMAVHEAVGGQPFPESGSRLAVHEVSTNTM